MTFFVAVASTLHYASVIQKDGALLNNRAILLGHFILTLKWLCRPIRRWFKISPTLITLLQIYSIWRIPNSHDRHSVKIEQIKTSPESSCHAVSRGCIFIPSDKVALLEVYYFVQQLFKRLSEFLVIFNGPLTRSL